MVETEDGKRDLESCLFDLATNSQSLDSFGQAFDRLANHVRVNSLGCKWPFFAYLAFVFRPDKCFPILPSQFDKLLAYYDTHESISYNVSWERYGILLELADRLQAKLALYSPANAIDIQSYIYVVSEIVAKSEPASHATEIEFTAALAARQPTLLPVGSVVVRIDPDELITEITMENNRVTWRR